MSTIQQLNFRSSDMGHSTITMLGRAPKIHNHTLPHVIISFHKPCGNRLLGWFGDSVYLCDKSNDYDKRYEKSTYDDARGIL